MKYPFEETTKGHPILDTEEKLQWYMNRLLHREVDLYFVNAEACNLDTVYLRRRKCLCLQQANMSVMPDAAPTFIEPDIYGQVDRSVVEVLREIHARRDAEMDKKVKEAAIEANKEQQRIRAEQLELEELLFIAEQTKEKQKYESWFSRLFSLKKRQKNNDA